MSQCSIRHLYLYWVVFLAIDKLMPGSSTVNKATGQVCRPAEKNRLGKKLSNINKNGINYCKLKTRDGGRGGGGGGGGYGCESV